MDSQNALQILPIVGPIITVVLNEFLSRNFLSTFNRSVGFCDGYILENFQNHINEVVGFIVSENSRLLNNVYRKDETLSYEQIAYPLDFDKSKSVRLNELTYKSIKEAGGMLCFLSFWRKVVELLRWIVFLYVIIALLLLSLKVFGVVYDELFVSRAFLVVTVTLIIISFFVKFKVEKIFGNVEERYGLSVRK